MDKVLEKGSAVRVLPRAFNRLPALQNVSPDNVQGEIVSVETLGDEPTGAFEVDYRDGRVIKRDRFWTHELN